MLDGAAIAFAPAWFFSVPKTFNPLSDDIGPPTTLELAPSLRRLRETDLIYTQWACRIVPVSTSHSQTTVPHP